MPANHISTSEPIINPEKSYGRDFMRGFLIAAPACAILRSLTGEILCAAS